MTIVCCEFPGCIGPWSSPDGDLATVVKLLEFHFLSKHYLSHQFQDVSVALPERAKRPVISCNASEEDWGYAMHRWKTYKRATHMVEEDILTELIACCSEELRQSYHSRFSNNKCIESETSCLSKLKRIALIDVNSAKLVTVTPAAYEPDHRKKCQYCGDIHAPGR